MDTVIVMMSTYNGERYLPEQINSILQQKDVKVILLVRDDGSQDKTLDILEEYSQRYDNVSYFTGNNLRSCGSFMNLVKESPDAPYYAFSDQDDVWLENKLSMALKLLKQETENIPLLYYSNLVITDENLIQKGMYFKKKLSIENKYSSLVEYTCTGCTMVFNKLLRDLLLVNSMPDCTMHDAWINMICSLFGKCIYDNNGYILYRQHENNVIGSSVRTDKLLTLLSRIKRLTDKKLQPRLRNAISFYRIYGDRLSSEDLEKVCLIVDYKKSMITKWKLLRDKDIKPENSSKMRFVFHVLFGTV